MAKKVLRYTEEEFVTLLENIVNKVKSEQKKIDESKQVSRTPNRKPLSESERIRRKNILNDRFKKLK